MSAEDFDQMKYTEAAWAVIAALNQAGDYYSSSQIEAPLMLDVLLNPTKHNAGADAEAAKRVATQVLQQSGVDVGALRSELETHMSKQPKITGTNSQKVLGRDLPKVLDSARTIQSVLGVSNMHAYFRFFLAFVFRGSQTFFLF